MAGEINLNGAKASSNYTKKGLKYILGVLILLEITDGILTNILISKGIAREGNPFLVHIAGENGFLVLKVVGVLVAAFIIWDIHRHYPRIAFWTGSAFLLIYAGIVAWNLHLLIAGL